VVILIVFLENHNNAAMFRIFLATDVPRSVVFPCELFSSARNWRYVIRIEKERMVCLSC